MAARILVVDDELEMGNFFTFLLDAKGHEVTVAENGAKAREALKEHFHLILLDLKLPDADGLVLLKEIKLRHPKSEVIVMTGYSTVKTAVEAIQLGAFDYLEKPFDDLDALEKIIENALNRSLAKDEQPSYETSAKSKGVLESIGFVTGKSEKMQRLLVVAEKLAQKHITLLIRGETGTGKEVLARYIHSVSPRSAQPFLAINCGALPENLLESELFGHEKGAFTGAGSQHKGIFELAHRGTLFLDEIGEANLSIQVKLLRVLETGEIFRVGGEKPIRVDTRVIAATNAPLEEMVKEKRFREDLFYRLDVVTLTVPPLRERREDICLLAEHFLSRHYQVGEVPRLSDEAIRALMEYDWPGNVRELANVMAQVAAMCDGPVVLKEHLPRKILENIPGSVAAPAVSAEIVESGKSSEQKWLGEIEKHLQAFAEQVDFKRGFELPYFLSELDMLIARATQQLIRRALKEAEGRYPKAAEWLGTTPRVLRYLNKEKHVKREGQL
ncbi:MAG TPA: sigma-54-dependent Fis family transcriptional regulator [Syntrophomonadaceae bacterium]|nr:sigma-54-dependent Fis family transcriptional regulator [Syntrophomonadaceae bacterium]